MSSPHFKFHPENEALLLLCRNVGDDCMHIIGNDLRAILSNTFNDSNEENFRIFWCSSAHVPSIYPPTLADSVHLNADGAHVHINDSNDRFLYLLVSARNYWNTSGFRQDAEVLENSTCVHCEEELSCVWFAVVRALFRVEQIGNENNRDTVLASKYFAFFQYLEICDSADNVDIATRFLRLRYSRSVSTEHEIPSAPGSFKRQKLDPGKCFSMTPIECVIGTAPLVPSVGD